MNAEVLNSDDLVALYLDKQGRITLPIEWRELWELQPGEKVLAFFSGREIRIVDAAAPQEFFRKKVEKLSAKGETIRTKRGRRPKSAERLEVPAPRKRGRGAQASAGVH